MKDLNEIKNEYVRHADTLGPRLSALSDSFFREPEGALKEFRTSAAMQKFLSDNGFEVEAGVAAMETAFRASIGAGRPAVALLAEMDALPGIGHGCGHNVSGTASVGAAAALASVLGRRFEGAVPGTVIVLGTPAEEAGGGKIKMVKAGLFDGIDAAMMVHCSSRRTIAKGFLGMEELQFIFHGRASHASAYPENGINALDAVIQTFNSINALRQQFAGDIRVHGIITDGGRAPNIIPERAEALFYVRAADLDGLRSIRERVVACAEGAARATGCTLDVVTLHEPNEPMKKNQALLDVYRTSLDFLGLAVDPYPVDKSLGSSDIGNVSQVVPTIHPHVPIREGLTIHTLEFAKATATPDGHRALIEGVKTLGLTAIELILNPDRLQRIRMEFEG